MGVAATICWRQLRAGASGKLTTEKLTPLTGSRKASQAKRRLPS